MTELSADNVLEFIEDERFAAVLAQRFLRLYRREIASTSIIWGTAARDHSYSAYQAYDEDRCACAKVVPALQELLRAQDHGSAPLLKRERKARKKGRGARRNEPMKASLEEVAEHTEAQKASG